MPKDLHTLPDHLPVPVDDGACAHLTGAALPAIALAKCSGGTVDLSTVTGTVVTYCYPMLGNPDAPPLPGWNEIPGARGCTPQACAFRDHHAGLRERGVTLYGISAQPVEEQREAHARLLLPFELLNDAGLAFARALELPTFTYSGRRLIRRLTLISVDGTIRKVFYPVFPPDRNAREVLEWITAQPA